jgi:hypothetical protein
MDKEERKPLAQLVQEAIFRNLDIKATTMGIAFAEALKRSWADGLAIPHE